MKHRILFFFLLSLSASLRAQVSVSLDGSSPNQNAVLDIKSPSTGHGLGFMIPRLTFAQRTVPNSAGGLTNASGNLWGGAAKGLLVFQTDSSGLDDAGIYFNNSSTATPEWVHIATGANQDWHLTGNSGTNAGTNFIGTKDNQAFEIHVNESGSLSGGNKRVMRFEPNGTSPNIIGGWNGNLVTTNVFGGTIGGGGSGGTDRNNILSDNFGTIGGGTGNKIGNFNGNYFDAAYGFIGGGAYNINSGTYSVIGGGIGDTVNAHFSFVGGGSWNKIDGDSSVILGGYENYINGASSMIAGGSNNIINNKFGAIGGGFGNSIDADYGFVGGGKNNSVKGNYSVVLGDSGNLVNGNFSSVIGGKNNNIGYAANYSLAFGNGATVTQSNTIVFNHPNSGDGTTKMGIDNNDPKVGLDIDGGLATRPATAIPVTTNNYDLGTLDTNIYQNRSFLILQSNAIPASRIISLFDGLQNGQILVLNVQALDSFWGVELIDNPNGSNLDLAGNALLDNSDTITLIWYSGHWYEVRRSHN